MLMRLMSKGEYLIVPKGTKFTGAGKLGLKEHSLRDKMDFLMQVYGFSQLVTEPTRIIDTSSTLIDVILTTIPSRCIKTDVIHTSYSDHSLVCTTISGKGISKKSASENVKEYRCFKNFSDSNFINDLKMIQWDTVEEFDDCDLAWKWFNEEFSKVCDKHCPLKRKKFRTNICPWLEGRDDIFDLMHKRDYHRKQSIKSKSKPNFHWDQYKILRNNVNDLMKKAKRDYYVDKIECAAGNCKDMWSTLKTILPSKPKGINVCNNDKAKEKADNFNKHFANICSTHDMRQATNDCKDSLNFTNTAKKPTKNQFTFQAIKEDDVLKEISKLSVNKSTGLDGIGPNLLKLSKNVISPVLTILFNLSMNQGKFPQGFKIAMVVPIYKRGYHDNCSNYRPISILSTCSKLLEKLIHKQLYSYVQENNTLFSGQSGFRPLYSTTTTLLKVTDDWKENIDRKNYIASVFIDLRKAFDTISHDILHNKLLNLGIEGTELKWFQSYLSKRSQRVIINDVLSDPHDINAGVPQGSILGPILFLLFINDMPTILTQCSIEMNADDTLLYTFGKDVDKIKHALNNDLKQLENWLRLNQMHVNVSKTKVMLLHSKTKRILHDFDVYRNDERLEIVDQYKYLGVIIDSNLRWQEHVDNLCKRISMKLPVLRRIKPFLSKQALITVFNSTILPLFDYACIVWSSCGEWNLRRLQVLQNKIMRVILSAHYLTHSRDLLK